MGVMPWLAVVVGFGLMLLGAWMLLGNTLSGVDNCRSTKLRV